jgi:hypothetical protein
MACCLINQRCLYLCLIVHHAIIWQGGLTDPCEWSASHSDQRKSPFRSLKHQAMKYEDVEVWLHIFLTSELGRDDSQLQVPAALPSGNRSRCLFKQLLRASSPGIKRPRREARHSPPSKQRTVPPRMRRDLPPDLDIRNGDTC